MRILSKLKKPKATRILGGALGLLLVLALVLMPAVPALAVETMPHWFHGTVTIGTDLALEGTIVSAKIDGFQYGDPVKGESYGTVDAEGRYGYGPAEGGTGTFKVPADDPDTAEKEGGEAGETVEFYITNEALGLDEVKANETALFESFGSTLLPLTITIPDTTAPTVNITALMPDPTNVNTPIFTGTATDAESNISSVEYKVDDGEWLAADAVDGTFDSKSEDYTFTTAELEDGAYTVYVRATDADMNTSTEPYASDEFVIDTTPPTVVITLPVDGAVLNTLEVLIEGTATEVAEVTVYGSGVVPVVDGVFSITLIYDDEGAKSIPVTATDAAGNVGSDTVDFTIDVTAPVSFTTTLLEDWNLLSTPIKLDAESDTLGQIFGTDVDNIEISYSWDAQDEDWDQLTNDYELLPLYGIYVKISSGASATAEFIPSEELSWPPIRELQPGLNLIGLAPVLAEGGFPEMPLDQALVTIAEAEGGFTGYTMVVSPAHNQTDWVYTILDDEVRDLCPYRGYWVVMTNAATLVGCSTTP